MKCYNHPERDAIAQCRECGKGLCEECAKKWDPPICDDCLRNNINAEFDSINRELIIYVGLVIAGAISGAILGSGKSDALPLAIMYACCFPIYAAGWKWMNHITDYFTLLATPKFWLVYIFVKLIFSGAVGMFALPYRLYYIYKRKKKLNSLLSYM